MEIFEVLHTTNPENGKEVKIMLTQEDTQAILNVGINVLLSLGMANFSTKKDGVDIAELFVDEDDTTQTKQ